jgi:hypothetical protein
MERWERREQKRQADARRIPKSGRSVRLIQELIGRRAAEAQKRAARENRRRVSASHYR